MSKLSLVNRGLCRASCVHDNRPEELKATQLRVVDPGLAIFIHIICLYHYRRAKRLVNEAGSGLWATASITFCWRVYVLFMRSLADYGSLFSSNMCCTLWSGVFTSQTNPTRVSGQQCCIHTGPSEPHSWPKPNWVDLNRSSVITLGYLTKVSLTSWCCASRSRKVH